MKKSPIRDVIVVVSRHFMLLMLIVIAAAQCAIAEIRETNVTGGAIKGSASDGVSSFKGIPFAAPPVGDLRWRAPQPVKHWNGVLKANSFGPACMQTIGEMAKLTGAPDKVSEDCLYLNVWTAAKDDSEKRPVMVWIHGGGFTGGMPSTFMFDGAKLAQKGVVLVSLAYRVGPFGFLAHPDLSRESGAGSGNYGLLDMIAGLQWVKQNVARFGGDPSCVTIFGQSAGGTAVSMLAASPLAKGLFRRVIAHSGASFASARTEREAGSTVPTLAFAELTGKRFLESLGARDLTAARALKPAKILENPSASTMGVFWPVADGHVVPVDQYELYLEGRFNDTPILVGTNSDEGAAFTRNPSTPGLFEQYVRNNFGSEAEAILAVYPHADDVQATQASKDIGRDNLFAWHVWTWARLQTLKGRNKAFVYYFDHRDSFAQGMGASHGAELGYVFGNLRGARRPAMMMASPPFGPRGQSPSFQGGAGFPGAAAGPNAADKALSELMISQWVSFAKTGDPNGAGLPPWPAFSEQQPAAMYFGDNSVGPQILPNLEKLKVLDSYHSRRRSEAKAH